MKIKDISSLNENSIVRIEAYIVDIEKKISKKGVLFYILELLDSSGKIKACVCPQHYDVESFDIKNDFTISYKIELLNDSDDIYYVKEII